MKYGTWLRHAFPRSKFVIMHEYDGNLEKQLKSDASLGNKSRLQNAYIVEYSKEDKW